MRAITPASLSAAAFCRSRTIAVTSRPKARKRAATRRPTSPQPAINVAAGNAACKSPSGIFMTRQVYLADRPQSFSVEDNDTLLAAGLRHGLSLPFGCQSGDRKSVGEGQSGAGRVDRGGRAIIKKTK